MSAAFKAMRIHDVSYRGTFIEPPYAQTACARDLAAPNHQSKAAVEIGATGARVEEQRQRRALSELKQPGSSQRRELTRELGKAAHAHLPIGPFDEHRSLPTNITDPPVLLNVNSLRCKNFGGSWPSGGPLYAPGALCGNWFEDRFDFRRNKDSHQCAKKPAAIWDSEYKSMCNVTTAASAVKVQKHSKGGEADNTWIDYHRGQIPTLYQTTSASTYGSHMRVASDGRQLPSQVTRPRPISVPACFERQRQRQTSYDLSYTPLINPEFPRAKASHIGLWR